MEQSAQDQTESHWAYCDKNHATIRNHLRDIFLCLDLDLIVADPSLKKQLEHLKNQFIARGNINTNDLRSLPRRVVCARARARLFAAVPFQNTNIHILKAA